MGKKTIMIFSILLLVLLVTAPAAVLRSAPLDCIFEHYSSEDGLSHNSISDIHQDRTGYIWLCTWYGLSRFDGNRFVNYTILPGDYTNLSHNRILSIDEDMAGALWITTYDYRLFRFDPVKEKFTAIPDDVMDMSLGNVQVKLFHCDRAGNTWVSLDGAGLCRISPSLESKAYFGNGDNIVGRHVKAIYEDSDGAIYTVSELGITVIRDGEPFLLSRSSGAVSFSEFGSRLYFLSGDQLLSIDRKTGQQSKVSLAEYASGRATAMSLSGSGDSRCLYIGFSDNAVASVDTSSLSLDVHRTDMGRVRYLFPDSEGLLWVATERTGIWSYNPEKSVFRHYEHPRNVMSYYVDSLAMVKEHGGQLWIKMNNYGFGYYDRENDTIVPLDNVKDGEKCRFMNGVACFEVDSTGVVWFSTVMRGLERVTVVAPKVEVTVPPTRSADELSSSEVRAVFRDSRDNVWVATKSRELYLYAPDMSSCHRFPDSWGLGNIYSIFEDSSGNIWLGTKGDGLVRLTRTGQGYRVSRRCRHDCSDRTSVSSDNIYSITQDRDGRMWFGTYGGGISMLSSPDAIDFNTVYDSFPDYPLGHGDRVRYVHCMPDGRMLVATIAGLIWFWPQDKPELISFHSVRKVPGDIHSLGNNDIIYIFDDNDGNTWLCTFGGGINRIGFDGDNARFDVISAADGLSSNIVLSAVCAENGDIWLATETGISKISGQGQSVTNYTKYDGLIPTTFSEATCARLKDGTLVFGTYDHLYRIDPDDFVYTPEPLMLVLSGLSIDGKRVSLGERIEIPHDASFFRIDFSSLNYRLQGMVNCSYMLDGYDKDWIAGQTSSATYSGIPPGKYVFRVKASSSHGNDADMDEVSIGLRVRPAAWNCLAARLAYAVACLLVVAILIKMFLTSMKLRNDVRLEQNLNNLKVRFFTNISHELRTPLTLILGGIDDIRKHVPEGDRSEYSANMVYKNARRMMSLVDQLLDIRRIVSGKMRLKVSHLDAVQMLRSVYDDFKDMAAERNMELSLTLPADSLMVWGDAGRLEALVYNLVSNAFKYTADGGRIEVAIFYKEGAGEYTIMVKDNGIGVPKDKRTAIFEMFVQASDASFRDMSSSGVGLSFCKEIVQMHDGRIWVESQIGKGSRFYVTLPVGKEHFSEETAEFVEDAAETADAGEQSGLGRYRLTPTFPADALKVLVVEDNAELRVYIYNCLINRYDVHDASNGKEALDLIAGGWMPDMIVTDLMMPEMDGIEFINRIRADFNTSHIPVIMITAKHENDTHVKAMKYGADGYIAKPFTMELLTARIENLLDRRKALISRLSVAVSGTAAGSRGAGSRQQKIDISPDEIVITDRDEELIKKVMKWLEDNVSDSDVTVDNLASYVGMGRTSMYNKLKGLTGKSPVELIQEFRLEKATYYLKSGQYSVSETSYKVGFSDPGYFSRSFKKHFGLSPADYIKENRQRHEAES